MFLNRQDPGLENYGKTDDKFISVNISYIIAGNIDFRLTGSEKIDKVSITLLGVILTIVVASVTGLIDDLHIVYQWFDL